MYAGTGFCKACTKYPAACSTHEAAGGLPKRHLCLFVLFGLLAPLRRSEPFAFLENASLPIIYPFVGLFCLGRYAIPVLTNVLIIGDSISGDALGYGPLVRDILELRGGPPAMANGPWEFQ